MKYINNKNIKQKYSDITKIFQLLKTVQALEEKVLQLSERVSQLEQKYRDNEESMADENEMIIAIDNAVANATANLKTWHSAIIEGKNKLEIVLDHLRKNK